MTKLLWLCIEMQAWAYICPVMQSAIISHFGLALRSFPYHIWWQKWWSILLCNFDRVCHCLNWTHKEEATISLLDHTRNALINVLHRKICWRFLKLTLTLGQSSSMVNSSGSPLPLTSSTQPLLQLITRNAWFNQWRLTNGRNIFRRWEVSPQLIPNLKDISLIPREQTYLG